MYSFRTLADISFNLSSVLLDRHDPMFINKLRVGRVKHLALASAVNAQCRQDVNAGFLTLLLDVNYLRPVPTNSLSPSGLLVFPSGFTSRMAGFTLVTSTSI